MKRVIKSISALAIVTSPLALAKDNSVTSSDSSYVASNSIIWPPNSETPISLTNGNNAPVAPVANNQQGVPSNLFDNSDRIDFSFEIKTDKRSPAKNVVPSQIPGSAVQDDLISEEPNVNENGNNNQANTHTTGMTEEVTKSNDPNKKLDRTTQADLRNTANTPVKDISDSNINPRPEEMATEVGTQTSEEQKKSNKNNRIAVTDEVMKNTSKPKKRKTFDTKNKKRKHAGTEKVIKKASKPEKRKKSGTKNKESGTDTEMDKKSHPKKEKSHSLKVENNIVPVPPKSFDMKPNVQPDLLCEDLTDKRFEKAIESLICIRGYYGEEQKESTEWYSFVQKHQSYNVPLQFAQIDCKKNPEVCQQYSSNQGFYQSFSSNSFQNQVMVFMKGQKLEEEMINYQSGEGSSKVLRKVLSNAIQTYQKRYQPYFEKNQRNKFEGKQNNQNYPQTWGGFHLEHSNAYFDDYKVNGGLDCRNGGLFHTYTIPPKYSQTFRGSANPCPPAGTVFNCEKPCPPIASLKSCPSEIKDCVHQAPVTVKQSMKVKSNVKIPTIENKKIEATETGSEDFKIPIAIEHETKEQDDKEKIDFVAKDVPISFSDTPSYKDVNTKQPVVTVNVQPKVE